jgi:hypothetical protein
LKLFLWEEKKEKKEKKTLQYHKLQFDEVKISSTIKKDIRRGLDLWLCYFYYHHYKARSIAREITFIKLTI